MNYKKLGTALIRISLGIMAFVFIFIYNKYKVNFSHGGFSFESFFYYLNNSEDGIGTLFWISVVAYIIGFAINYSVGKQEYSTEVNKDIDNIKHIND